MNTLWPVIPIWTAATKMIAPDKKDFMFKPEIMADAAYTILTQGIDFTGNFVLDQEILKEKHGIADFTGYQVDPTTCFKITASLISHWLEISACVGSANLKTFQRQIIMNSKLIISFHQDTMIEKTFLKTGMEYNLYK